MMRILLSSLLCVFAVQLSAQPFTFHDQAFLGSLTQAAGGTSGQGLDYVTNQSGYLPLAFWLPTVDTFVTNGSTIELHDTSPVGLAFDLTNSAATSRWPSRQVEALNGHDTIKFAIGLYPYLRCINFTNFGAFPTDFMMVVKYADSTNNTSRNFFSTSPLYLKQAITSALRLYDGGTSFDQVDFDLLTNKWMVVNTTVDVTGGVQTNNVTYLSGAVGLTNTISLTLANSIASPPDQGGPLEVAAFVVYTNATATVRSNAFYAFTNYFNLAP